MTELQRIHPYSCQAYRLIRWFFDQDILGQRTAHLGARELTLVRHQFDGESGILEFSRDVPAPQNVPKTIKRFQQEWNRVHYKETWQRQSNGHFRGEVQARISGVPVEVVTHLHLKPAAQGEGCENHIRVQITSQVPLLGRVIESVVCGDVDRQLETEYRFFQTLLETEPA
ncbi:DUF2505 domain-containing protein [Hahella sp. SMD15-11]|uniref:DUF2505 domain-containing protein n=1 Tax=Thermohahella caldifontis TaxID=3142973 RepID=A0AB39UXT6_9GAMM